MHDGEHAPGISALPPIAAEMATAGTRRKGPKAVTELPYLENLDIRLAKGLGAAGCR
jgi:hypothetical protein